MKHQKFVGAKPFLIVVGFFLIESVFGANPFLGRLSLKDFRETSLDLDHDGTFDFYEQTWGPVRIRRVFPSNLDSHVFRPTFQVAVTLGNGLVYNAFYGCDQKKCSLQHSTIGKSPIFFNSNSNSVAGLGQGSKASVDMVKCEESPGRKYLNELIKTSEATQLKLAAAQAIDVSCIEGDGRPRAEDGKSDVGSSFERIISAMREVENRNGFLWKCLSQNPELENIGYLVAEKVSEILSGMDSLRIGCQSRTSEDLRPRMMMDPRRMLLPKVPWLGCSTNYMGQIGHELAHQFAGDSEGLPVAFEACIGVPSLESQQKTCEKSGAISGEPIKVTSNLQVISSIEKEFLTEAPPVNIATVMQLTPDPADVDRTVPGARGSEAVAQATRQPAAGITRQGLEVLNAARAANPQAFYGVPAKYFNMPEGMAITPRIADAGESRAPTRRPSSMAIPSATPRRSGTSSSFESAIPASVASNGRTSDTGGVGTVQTRTVRLNTDTGVLRASTPEKINIASGTQLVSEGGGGRSGNSTPTKPTASRSPARSPAARGTAPDERRDVAASSGTQVATPTARQPSSSGSSGLATGGDSLAGAINPNSQGSRTRNPSPNPNPNPKLNPTQAPGTNQKASAFTPPTSAATPALARSTAAATEAARASATANQAKKLLPAGLVQAIKADLSLTDFQNLQKKFGPALRSKGVVIETIHGTIGAPIDKANQKFSIKDGKLKLIGANSPSGGI